MNTPDDSTPKTAKTLPKLLRWWLHKGYPDMTDGELIEKMEEAGATDKERYKLWFNRIDLVLYYPHFVLHWIVVILAWNAVVDGDWFYRLLLSLSVATILGPVVALDSCLKNHRHNWWKICRQRYQAASRRLTMSWMARSAL
jgi:hypothetical protein